MCLGEIKSLPVITNLHQQGVPLPLEAEPGVCGAGMASNIGETFLDDTEDHLLCTRREQLVRREIAQFSRDFSSRAVAQSLALHAQRLDQSHVLQGHW